MDATTTSTHNPIHIFYATCTSTEMEKRRVVSSTRSIHTMFFGVARFLVWFGIVGEARGRRGAIVHAPIAPAPAAA
jgi:hypothetical protein